MERLSKEEQGLLIQHSNLIFKNKGSYIFMEGDKATHLFFVKKGIVRVHKLLSEGKEITIFLRGKNGGFGEIGPFSGVSYSCSSRAETDCEIYAIDQKPLDTILISNGKISFEFIKWLAEKLETNCSKMKDFLMFGTEGAIASLLIRLANSKGIQLKEGILIREKITHYNIATHIGSSRETVTRIMNDYKKRDVIEFRNKGLLIKNITFQRKILSCDKCGVQNCVF